MRKLKKVTATLGGIAVAGTIAFGVSVASASSAQADCSGSFFSRTCTDTPHNNWTTTTTGIFKRHTTVTNPGGNQPPGQQPSGGWSGWR
jgi:hypothetical protein